nr:MAG TPA: hypothetical protein [Caudoviricetes sp.]
MNSFYNGLKRNYIKTIFLCTCTQGIIAVGCRETLCCILLL